MTSRFTEIVIDAHDLRKLADFWCAVLDYKIIDEQEGIVEIAPQEYPSAWTDEATIEWKAKVRAAPPAPTILFGRVPEHKTIKNRVHIDVCPIASQEEEVERLLKLGATKADVGQGDVRWVVMRDPEGNPPVCLRSSSLRGPRLNQSAAGRPRPGREPRLSAKNVEVCRQRRTGGARSRTKPLRPRRTATRPI